MTNDLLKFLILLLSLLEIIKGIQTNNTDIIGDNCKITEPIYNYTFNFNSLHSDLGHIIKNNNGDIIEFNICGNLSRSCGENKNAGACLTRGKKQILLGINHELTYKNGRMFFSFGNGEKCSNGKSYMLHVLVRCDYTLDAQPFTIQSYGDDECSFYISWETPQACLPEPDNVKRSTCSVKDEKTGYNFNLMALSDENREVNDRNGSTFIINVCKPVLYDQNSMCPPGSSICFVDKNSSDIKTKYINFGNSEPNPTLENGQLIMNFTSPTACNPTTNITSIIYFHCEPSIKTGTPDFLEKRGCNNIFTWETSLACPNTKPCIANHPNSGLQYDLSLLSGKQYKLNQGNEEYTFGVCSDSGSPCLEHSGACKISNGQTTSFGIMNSQLLVNITGSPYLIYNSGAPCNGRQWTTKIEFICASNGVHNEPKIIENTDCTLVIHFSTNLVCQEQITCEARSYLNEEKIDLTPLINSKENYVAKINDSLKTKDDSVKYFLNVCRPLIPQFGLSCPGGSAACKAVMGVSTPEQELSLGFPDVSLTMTNKSRAELKYLRGSPCPADNKTDLSTTIDFYCDEKAGKGVPILQSIIDDCHYHFDWATNVICSTHKCEFNSKTCELFNEQLNKTINFRKSNYTNNGKIMIKNKDKPDGFQIDICGSDRKAVTDYAESTVKVFFKANAPCGRDDSISVEFRVVCNDTEHRSSIGDESSCTLMLTQETPEICPFLGIILPPQNESVQVPVTTTSTTLPTIKITNTTTTTTKATTVKSTEKSTTEINPTEEYSKGSSNSTILAGIITTIIFVGIIVGIVFLARSPRMRSKIRNIFRRSGPLVQYTRVETNEEANLLLPQNGHFTDSDDDLLI